jgi:hypothetical protein
VSNAQSRTIEYICGVLFATSEVDGKLCSTFSPSHRLLCRSDWFVITSISDPQYEHPRPFLPSSHNAFVHLLHQSSPSVALTTFLNHTQLHHHPSALAASNEHISLATSGAWNRLYIHLKLLERLLRASHTSTL